MDSALTLGAGIVAEHDGWAVLGPRRAVVLRGPLARRGRTAARRGRQPSRPGVPRHRTRLLRRRSRLLECPVARLGVTAGRTPRVPCARSAPPGLPIRILLQRLGEDRLASAHLDLALRGHRRGDGTRHERHRGECRLPSARTGP
ncbi:hypothetical protein ACRAWF_37875 [Streptomyces sp. L7]